MALLWCRSGALVSTKPQVRLGDLANVFCVILDRASAECCCFWAAARICCSPASHYKQRAGHSLPASPHSTSQSSFTLPTAYQGAPLLLRLCLLVLPLEALSRPTVPALQDGDGSRRQGLGHGHRDGGQLQRQPLGALPVGFEGQRRHLVAPISWLAVGATLGIGSPHL